MEKIKPILNIVIRVLFIIALLGTTILSLATAYIVFAPDSFPKPFYLLYAYPDEQFELPPGTIVVYQGGSAPSTNTTSSGHTTTGTGTTDSHAITGAGSNFPAGQGIMFDTGTKIINLADPGGRRYLRVNVVLEYAPNDVNAYAEYLASHSGGSGTEMRMPASGGGGETTTVDYVAEFTDELSSIKPLIDDVITTTISSYTYEQIYTTEGKEALKSTLMTKINERIPGYTVIAVYFPEFVVE